MVTRDEAVDLVRRFGRRWVDDDVSGKAAGVAFYAVLALFPSLLAMAAALGSMETLLSPGLAEEVRTTVLEWMNRVLTEQADDTQRAVQRLFDEGNGDILTFATVGALWAGSRGTNAVMRAMSRIYGVADARAFWQRRLVALGLLAATVVAAALALSMFVLGPLLGGGRRVAETVGLGDTFVWLWEWLRVPVVFLGVTAWAAAVFHIAPDGRKGWKPDLPGALATGVLWVLASLGLRVYLGVAGEANQVLGALGGALIVLVWLYLLALALLTGGELNVVLLERKGRPDVEDAERRRIAQTAATGEPGNRPQAT